MDKPPGCLLYVCGPSGVGKDALLRAARERLESRGFIFPERAITRPPHGSEKHIPMSEADFDAAARAGLFCMQWASHGLRYGIPAKILQDLAQGSHVVVNGSREYVATARQLFPQLVCVMISAPAEVLAARLAQRGREDEEAIAGRLARNQSLAEIEADVVHENHGDLAASSEAFISLLLRLAREHGSAAPR